MALSLNQDQYGRKFRIDTSKLVPLCRLVRDLTGVSIPLMKPVGGDNVFATEAGIHQDGLLKHRDTYLPFYPEDVGADGIQFVLGRHSGKKAVAHRLHSLQIPNDEGLVTAVVQAIKRLPKGKVVNDQVLLDLLEELSHE